MSQTEIYYWKVDEKGEIQNVINWIVDDIERELYEEYS